MDHFSELGLYLHGVWYLVCTGYCLLPSLPPNPDLSPALLSPTLSPSRLDTPSPLPLGHDILVLNWVQPRTGTDCRPEARERRWVGRRGEGQDTSFSTASLLQMRLWLDWHPPRTRVLERWPLFQDSDSHQALAFWCSFFLLPLRPLGWWCFLSFLVPGASLPPIDSPYFACSPINDSFIKVPFRW